MSGAILVSFLIPTFANATTLISQPVSSTSGANPANYNGHFINTALGTISTTVKTNQLEIEMKGYTFINETVELRMFQCFAAGDCDVTNLRDTAVSGDQNGGNYRIGTWKLTAPSTGTQTFNFGPSNYFYGSSSATIMDPTKLTFIQISAGGNHIGEGFLGNTTESYVTYENQSSVTCTGGGCYNGFKTPYLLITDGSSGGSTGTSIDTYTATSTGILVTGTIDIEDFKFASSSYGTPTLNISLFNYDTGTTNYYQQAYSSTTTSFTFATSTSLPSGAYNAIYSLNTIEFSTTKTSSFTIGTSTFGQGGINGFFNSGSSTIDSTFGDCNTATSTFAGTIGCYIGNGISKAGILLFSPDQGSIMNFYNINDQLSNKIPFVYLYQINDLRSGLFNTTGSSTLTMSINVNMLPNHATSTINIISPTIIQNSIFVGVLNIIRTLISYMLWFMLINNLWHKTLRMHDQQ